MNDGLLNNTSVIRDSKFAPLMFRHANANQSCSKIDLEMR